MANPEVIISEPFNPDVILQSIGVDAFLDAMDRAAKQISSRTKLGPDESWDDPEEYYMEGVILAHGYEALNRYLANGGAMPRRWRQKEG